jgi:hypothetical protein
MPASYILLLPHYLAQGGYTPAGTTVTEGGAIPVGWRPTIACDPQNSQAIQNYWNAGPMSGAELNFLACPQPKPQIYWQPIPGSTSGAYQLTGAGASLGPHT